MVAAERTPGIERTRSSTDPAKAARCAGSRYWATGKDTNAVSTFSDWNPGLVRSKRTKLRTKRPAAIKSTREAQTSKETIDSRSFESGGEAEEHARGD